MSAPFADLGPSSHRRPFYDTATRPPLKNVGQPHGWPGISRFSGAANSMGESPETRAARPRRPRMDSALKAQSCPSVPHPHEVLATALTSFRCVGYGEPHTRTNVCSPLAPSVPRPPRAVPACRALVGEPQNFGPKPGRRWFTGAVVEHSRRRLFACLAWTQAYGLPHIVAPFSETTPNRKQKSMVQPHGGQARPALYGGRDSLRVRPTIAPHRIADGLLPAAALWSYAPC